MQYRNKFGAVQPPGRADIPEISMQFTLGNLHVSVGTAESSIDQQLSTSAKRLKRTGYACQPPYPTEVAGFPDGRGRVVAKKKKGRQPAGPPLLQLYAMAGPYSFFMTAPQAQAALLSGIGPVTVDPVAPPAIAPIVRIGVPDVAAVAEQIILTERRATVQAVMTRDPVTASSDQFATSCLQAIMGNLKGAAVNEGQPDMFLGDQYCVRHTFVTGGTPAGSPVRSQHWWAGVVAGYGVQIFVRGTKPIIDLDQARGLKDLVVLIPPD